MRPARYFFVIQLSNSRVGSIHIPPGSDDDNIILPQPPDGVHSADRYLPGPMIQQRHIQIKAGDPLSMIFLWHNFSSLQIFFIFLKFLLYKPENPVFDS